MNVSVLLSLICSVEKSHSFAIAVAAYVCGIILGNDIVVAFVAAILFMFTVATAPRWPNVSVAKLVAIVSAACSVGVCAGAIANARLNAVPYRALSEHHIVVQGLALERPRVLDTSSLRVRILDVERAKSDAAISLRGRVALLSFPAEKQLGSVAGTVLEIRGRVDLPASARNEGEPSERDTLADQGVELILAAHRATDIRVLGPGTGWTAWWARARQRIAFAVESHLPPLEATVLEGILWGDRGNLPAGLRQEFSDTGTVHVLTTAGLHLGIMTGLLAGLLLLLPLNRPARMILVVAGGWLYAALAGMHLPTLRAATMLTAGTLAQELGRGRTTSAVLAAAACAVAIPHPLAALSPSFSMSFACVAGIALLNPAFSALGLREGCGLPRWLIEVLRTSLSVQIALWPLQALYFNAFTPYAVIANAVVVPLVGIVMGIGTLFAIAALSFPPLAIALGNLIWWGLTFLIGTVEHFAALPMAHIDVPPPSHAFLVSYWLALGAFAWFAQTGRFAALGRARLRHYCVLGVAALIIAYITPGIRSYFDQDLHLDAIDVGQADCLLIRAPGGHALLIDGGGKLERTTSGAVAIAPIGDRIATRTVMPFLLRHWILHLDAVVLTHPHGDHVGGLPVILSREPVESVYDSAQLYYGPAYHHALEVMRERHIRWIRAQRGVAFNLGPTTHVAVLAPELPLIIGTTSDINNNSVVLRVTFGHIAMLLTGDAQSEAEARLLSHGGTDLRAEILKVGHHGSAYSSTAVFLGAVRPKIAIISCGLHNVFGHPSSHTLAALQAAGARTYRTDIDGGVSIESDGIAFRAETMRQKL